MRLTRRFRKGTRSAIRDGRVVEKGGYDILARGEEQAKRAARNWYCRGSFADSVLKREVVSVD